MTMNVVSMIFGMLAMGYIVAAAFFLRFWRRTSQPIFAYFAAAFTLLAIQRVAGIVTTNWLEDTTWLYVLRLLAFVVIIGGILAANRSARRG